MVLIAKNTEPILNIYKFKDCKKSYTFVERQSLKNHSDQNVSPDKAFK